MTTVDYDTEITSIVGEVSTLRAYEGKVLLVVNTASQCGFTPQYGGLEALWKAYRERGLVVLGFPCNQFARQEPGLAAEIADFCRVTHGVSFPLHDKVDVNGSGAHPLFRQLKAAAPGLLGTQAIKWNFTKFLIGRQGQVIRRFAPRAEPASLVSEIEALL